MFFLFLEKVFLLIQVSSVVLYKNIIRADI